MSKANPKNKEFRSGLQERKGVTAHSLWGFWHNCELHQPPVLILENVIDEFLSDTSNNFDQFKRSFSEIGYAIKHVLLDASMWVPHRRKRVYIIALNMRSSPWTKTGLARPAARWYQRLRACLSKPPSSHPLAWSPSSRRRIMRA